MGFYILDSHVVGARGKLAMLKDIPGATEIDYPPANVEMVKKVGMYPVVWVDNHTFEAVAICYDNQEQRRQMNGMAGRHHKWFLVPTKRLAEHKPAIAEYINGERDWRER